MLAINCCTLHRLPPMIMLKILSFAAIGGFAVLILPTAAQAQSPATPPLNPYPNEILTELLETCVAERQRFNLTIPLNVGSTKSVRSMADAQTATISKWLQESEKDIDRQAKNANEQVEKQLKERKAELAELIQDRPRLADQIKQIKYAIENKQAPENQLKQLKQVLKDLQDLQRDSALLAEKANDIRQEWLQKNQKMVDSERRKIRQSANQRRSLLTSCTCKIEAIQQRYTYPAFSKRALEEITIGPALSKDWAEVTQQCQK
jgi:hypothetical protein